MRGYSGCPCLYSLTDPRVNYMYTKEYLSLRISGTSIMRVEHISETFTVQYD